MWSNDRFSIMRTTMWSTLSRLGEWLVSVTARLLLEVAAAFRPRPWRDTPHNPHPASLAKSSPGWGESPPVQASSAHSSSPQRAIAR